MSDNDRDTAVLDGMPHSHNGQSLLNASIGIDSAQPVDLADGRVASAPGRTPLRATDDLLAFDRPSDEQAAWERTRGALAGLGLTEGRGAAGKLSLSARRIDAGFSFSTQEHDSDFSPFHVEPLLDQAADLLDRGVRDRATSDDLGSKWALVMLELSEYMELDDIHRDEEASGIYTVARDESRAEEAAERTNAQARGVSRDFTTTTIERLFSTDESNRQYNAARVLAWLTGVVPYTWQGQVLAGYSQYSVLGEQKTVYDAAMEAAEKQSSHWLSSRVRELASERLVYSALSQVAAARITGLEARALWETKNANFQRRRTIVARRHQDIKARLAVDADGLLNYARRLDSLRKRFHDDFRHALARLVAAQQGLVAIYGYDVSLPDPKSPDYFDDCLRWTRDAIQWLVRFARQEQSAVIPVSLRARMGEDAWKAGERAGRWEFDVSELGDGALRHQRLRGLSAVVVGGKDKAVWHFRVSVPARGRFTRLDGSVIEVDQGDVPEVILGRVAGRDSVRSPDVVGVTSLHNASPVGRWVVTFGGALNEGKLKDLDDIQLDLHIAFRRQARSRRPLLQEFR